jgi:N6-adenosine-specific RNA methylase IME4
MTPDVFAELNPPYSTIVVDPPWPYPEGWPGFSETSHGGDVVDHRDLPYSAMSLDEIARLPVGDLAAPGSQLFLWTTNRYLFDARDICLGWGFNPARVLVWCKPPMGKGVGGTFASTTEFVVHARRATRARQVERAGQLIREAREEAGLTRAELHRLVRGGAPTGIVYRWEDDDSLPNPTDWARLQEVLPGLRGVERPCVPPPDREASSLRFDTSWWIWPHGRHSEKPPAFLDIVEQVSPGPYVELFARQPRLGWDSWGWGYELGAAS